MSEKQPLVYLAISQVQEDLATMGISKDKQNKGFGASYSYRGIDDVYQTLSPLLAKHRLVIIPRTLSRECVERTSAKGNALFYVSLDVEFDFVCTHDGSIHTARAFGEAMDSGDKATNKAFSAAYKYLCFLTFCIPVEGSPDADSESHVVEPKKEEPKKPTFKEVSERISKATILTTLSDIHNNQVGLFEGEEKVELMTMLGLRKEELREAR